MGTWVSPHRGGSHVRLPPAPEEGEEDEPGAGLVQNIGGCVSRDLNVVTALQSLDRQTGLVKIQSEQRKFKQSVVRPKIKRPSGQSSNGHPVKDQTAIRSKIKRPSGQSSNGRPVKVQTAVRSKFKRSFDRSLESTLC